MVTLTQVAMIEVRMDDGVGASPGVSSVASVLPSIICSMPTTPESLDESIAVPDAERASVTSHGGELEAKRIEKAIVGLEVSERNVADQNEVNKFARSDLTARS